MGAMGRSRVWNRRISGYESRYVSVRGDGTTGQQQRRSAAQGRAGLGKRKGAHRRNNNNIHRPPPSEPVLRPAYHGTDWPPVVAAGQGLAMAQTLTSVVLVNAASTY